MLLNLFIGNILAKEEESMSLLGVFEVNMLRIITSILDAGVSMYEHSGIFTVLNLEIIYLLIVLNASSALCFAGIRNERFGVVFYLSVFTYTILGALFSGLFTKLGESIGFGAEVFQILVSFLFSAVFLVFYEIVKPVFMAICIFLIYTGFAELIGHMNVFVHLIFLILLIVAMQFVFKIVAPFYKWVLVILFSLYGSLMMLSCIYAITNFPPSFSDYINNIIEAKTIFGGFVESWISILWMLMTIFGVSGQYVQLDSRIENEKSKKEPESE
ncbi:hypothetical protein NUSPORA_00494 [Nucleospora cyclopteri]